ncbi:hypothetical protein [Caballeronia sp. Lep1P3]|uniref:hypothetical protein n=1 Tax=Caballeronia sp. Lep1P3 TaxID=2878150 RepID=UPI001FCFC607|nr:hypothetical protein [Caballeronia sp. Lep1P3]
MRAIVVSALLLLYASASFGDDTSGDIHKLGAELLVYDAQGRPVAPLDDYGGQGVYLTINGAIAFAFIERTIVSGDGGPQTVYSGTNFRWSGTNAVDFTSSDCSGTPIITLTSGVRPSLAVRRGADVTLYVAPDTNSAPMRVASTLSGPNFQCTTATVPTTEYGWPAAITYSLTGSHPEPLTIRDAHAGPAQSSRE